MMRRFNPLYFPRVEDWERDYRRTSPRFGWLAYLIAGLLILLFMVAQVRGDTHTRGQALDLISPAIVAPSMEAKQ